MAFGGSSLWRLLLTYALAVVFGCLAWWYSNGSVWWSLGAAYLPSFFDGSQHLAHGRHWPWFQRLPIWRWVARNSFSSTPKVLQEAPLPASQQVLLGLHPHGVISAHHLLLMTVSVVAPAPYAFTAWCLDSIRALPFASTHTRMASLSFLVTTAVSAET